MFRLQENASALAFLFSCQADFLVQMVVMRFLLIKDFFYNPDIDADAPALGIEVETTSPHDRKEK